MLVFVYRLATNDLNTPILEDREEIKPDVSQGQTTGFTEDSTVMVNDHRSLLFEPSSTNVYDRSNIALFMEKPFIVATGTWTDAQIVNTILDNQSILGVLNANPQWQDKLRGYSFFRGTAIFRLELNAQPFHAGKLLMHFLPQYDIKSTYSIVEVNRNLNLTTKTQQPNVEIDCRDSSATMEIPYISPFSHIPVASTNAQFDWGRLFISILSPLKTGAGQGSVQWALFLSFKDVEVCAPTAQSGRTSGSMVLKRERKNHAKTGIISSTLDVLRDVNTYFMPTNVFSKGVDSALSASSKVASAFGWSKPLSENLLMPIFRQCCRMLGNFNGPNTSDVLALDALNTVDHIDNFGGLGIDEMDFSYLKSIRTYWRVINWPSTSTYGTILYNADLELRDLSSVAVGKWGTLTRNLNSAPPFVYLSRYFVYSRGSIDLTIKFVKTQFHTGKIMVVWSRSAPSGISGTQNALREIIDIKDSDEITLNLPYLSNQSYLRTGWSRAQNSVSDPMGHLSIYVLNPLVSPDTVASNIDMLLYLNGGNDFELASPTVYGQDRAVAPQMNVVDKVLARKRIGGYPDTPMTMTPVTTCIGETFTSIKQLISAAHPVSVGLSTGALVGPNSVTNYYLSFFPFTFALWAPRNDQTNSTDIYPPIFGADFLSELVSGYGHYRGSMRYIIPPHNFSSFGTTYAYLEEEDAANRPVITNAPVTLNTTHSFGVTPAITAYAARLTPAYSQNIAVRKAEEEHLDVTVPHYSPCPMKILFVSTAQGNANVPSIPQTADTGKLRVTYQCIGSNFAPPNWGLLRHAGDDFQVSYFIGFPPYT